ncbi:TetR/AcrR family transcriptional regulator [Phenylobacterium sp. LjRoot225]|uniref:TetR/AcrR family transcriptional regulator n=1 Tax=Phenylobacterium sp. LjRoot225 TaxID=3342285 RepID=UPI003ED0D1B2
MAGRGPKGAAKRTLLLDTAEKLIVAEGYAAVSTRRVGLEAGVKPPLVHYYFPTTEDLLLAVYERAAQQAHQRTLEALSAPQALQAFWTLSRESAHTSLGTELYALANHRKGIRTEIARTAVDFRASEAEALSRALGERLDQSICDPKALIVLISGISRILVMEEATGLTDGHAEVRALIDWLLKRVARPEPQDEPAEQPAS